LLAALSFNPAANYNSNFTIAMHVDDGALSIDGVKVITGVAVNDAPVLVNNNLTLAPGANVVLSNANLSATDDETSSSALTFTVSGISGGRFEYVATPGTAITSFTQGDVGASAVRFVHDGGALAPVYQVTVSDGALTVGPVAATISFVTQSPSTQVVDTSFTATEPSESDTTSATASTVSVVSVAAATPPNAAPTTPPAVENPNNGNSPETQSSSGAAKSVSNDGESPANVATPAIPAIVVAESPAPARIYADAPKPATDMHPIIALQNETASAAADSDQDETKGNGFADLSSVIDMHGFVQGLNELRDEVREDLHLDKVTVGSTVAVTTGFSIGYVLWLLRGEVLLSSLLASLPAWRLVDPLPVLAYLSKGGIEDPEGDDSFESVIKKGADRPSVNRAGTERQSNSVTWRIVTEDR
jgi:hypothetical protein